MEGRFEAYDRGDRAWAVWPTNDDLTLVIVGWPIAQFDENKHDFEGHYLRAFDRAPQFAERIRGAKREERLVGASVPNFFRKPYGPGWALVGDAGYTRDFMTAQGINDAFRDSELCANALDEAWSGRRTFDEAMADYQARRDRQVRPLYEFTCDFASFTPPTPEKRQLMGAIHGNPEAMDGFARVIAGVTSPTEFFSEENIGRIFAGAAARAMLGHDVRYDPVPRFWSDQYDVNVQMVGLPDAGCEVIERRATLGIWQSAPPYSTRSD